MGVVWNLNRKLYFSVHIKYLLSSNERMKNYTQHYKTKIKIEKGNHKMTYKYNQIEQMWGGEGEYIKEMRVHT
jgi:hypothetical protein